MKKKPFGILLILISLLICTAAYAMEIEIVSPNVNFRKEPGGSPLGRFAGGEILEVREECFSGGQLWYRAVSETLGEGFVSGEFAKPVRNGVHVYQPEHPEQTDFLTENDLEYLLAFYRFLFERGYCYWDEEAAGVYFRIYDGAWEEGVVRPEHETDLVELLLQYGLVAESERTEEFVKAETQDEKLSIASEILRNHYGTDDPGKITATLVSGPNPELHVPHGYLSSRDVQKEKQLLEQVNREYGKPIARDTEVPMDTIFYYNPDGGSKYHVDRNCPSTSPKFLPFSGSFTRKEKDQEPYSELMPCNVCGAPQ